MKTEHVILVDEKDNPIGTAEKLAAHEKGLLHRAFSVFLFCVENNELKTLLQQRQHDKYHCGGLWSNSCCSHPRPGEDILTAGKRRLQEELGITFKLKKAGEFHYTAHFENGLTENEYDHVLIGFSEKKTIQEVPFNTNEVAAVKWMPVKTLEKDLAIHPEHYTPWFKQALEVARQAAS